MQLPKEVMLRDPEVILRRDTTFGTISNYKLPFVFFSLAIGHWYLLDIPACRQAGDIHWYYWYLLDIGN
jgi:hypothetical protein